jgi:carbon storage regulator
MLVLNRRKEESVMIGEVEVKVIGLGSDKVRLGIQAPPEVRVHRKEVWEKIQREKGKDNG